ncbi:MAG: agmatine deiminase family protein [Bacteroidales bacterium]|nr:agmatine deiminase family protein [Bacteroidales bacterium]
MKKSVFLFLFCFGFISFSVFQSFSQEKPKTLTHHMSPEEKAMFHLVGKGYKGTDPPPGEIRNIAEFDQMEGVLIRYPFGINYQLIAGMSEEIIVTTIVETQSQQNYITGQYESHGVNMENVNFLLAESDSYWTRDYGPWYVTYGEDQIGIVDFIYNRPRPLDNAIPLAMADFLGIEWFGMELIHAGGNYMTDGMGISSSSELVWEENPTMTHEEIDQMVNEYLGINTYHVIPDPNNTYIDHIDCWGKFLDIDKVLIREVPPTHSQYDEIEATADYYANQVSAYGNNYEVYRVFTPNNQPYTNSLILNNRVLVPITGSPWDDDAIASYQEVMPGYDIIGFTGSWESTDALHCRTKGIADRNMLYIKHLPLFGIQPFQPDYEIEAEITAYSGQPIYNDSVRVVYWINGGNQEEIVMTYEGGKLYSAVISGVPENPEISYYIHAADESGKSVNHPFIGEPDPHIFSVGEELTGISNSITDIQINNYPNPFCDKTTIEFTLRETSSVLLEIYNYQGKNIYTLIDKELNSGSYLFDWHGIDKSGMKVRNGIYFYRLKTGTAELTRKMILIE